MENSKTTMLTRKMKDYCKHVKRCKVFRSFCSRIKTWLEIRAWMTTYSVKALSTEDILHKSIALRLIKRICA